MSTRYIHAIDLRSGNVIKYEGLVYKVESAESAGTGRGANYTKLCIRNLKSGCAKDVRINPEVKLEMCNFEHIEYSVLYDNGDEIVCNDENGKEVYFSKKNIDSELLPLITDEEIDDIKIVVQYLDEKIFKILLPKKFTARIIETEPYIKKQTVSSSYKPAILVNGWKISVPQFIEQGDKIIADSETKEYTNRAE